MLKKKKNCTFSSTRKCYSKQASAVLTMINSLHAFTSVLLFMSLLDCFRAGGYSVAIHIQ